MQGAMYHGPLQHCVVGDAAAAVQYASERMVPVLHAAMAEICLEKSTQPLTRIQKTLKNEAELRTARSTDVQITMPPKASSAGVQQVVAAPERPKKKSSPFQKVGDGGALNTRRHVAQSLVDIPLHFESRPCLLTKPKDFVAVPVADTASTSPAAPPPASTVIPRSFQRCGDYDVFLSEVPPKSMLPQLARAVREQMPHVAHITWVLVSTDATIAMYFGEQPYKARVAPGLWSEMKDACSGAGFFSLGPASAKDPQSPTTATVDTLPAASHRHRHSVDGKTPRKSKPKGATPSTTPRGAAPVGSHLPVKLPVDDALLEQLIGGEVVTAAGRKGNAMSVCEAIRSIAQVPTAGAPAPSAQHLGVSAPAPSSAASLLSQSQLPSLVRLFHPPDVAVSKPLIETVWQLLTNAEEHSAEQRKHQKIHSPTTAAGKSANANTIAPSTTAYVVLSVDQTPLAQHVATLLCLHQRTRMDIEGWRLILNATERIRDRNYVYDFEKIEHELKIGREKRDDMRRMLREAQLNQLQDSGLTTTAAEFLSKWESMFQWHIERREKEDQRRQALDILQGSGAAVRVQSIIRGAMTRRKTNGVVLRKVKHELKDFEGPYRRGRFPIVDATMEYLQYVFGPQMITAEQMRRGQMREGTRWKRSKMRVPPQDVENDVSSEEEVWEEEVYEKVYSEGTGAINPMHMADVCMAAVKSCDKDILFDAFINFPNVPVVQERAFRGSMERLVHYILIATYWSAKHRIRAGNGSDTGPYASTNLLNMPVKLKNSCETYDQFTTEFRRPQEWLNHPQFSLLLLTNIPQPLHQSRLLVASPTAPNGSSVEGVGRADLMLPSSPVYLVAEGSSMDQWAEAIGIVQRSSIRCKKVLWLSTTPNFCIYVNGVPMHLVERQKGATYSSKAAEFAEIAAPLVASVIKPTSHTCGATGSGTVLTASDEVMVEVDEGRGAAKGASGDGAKSGKSPFAVVNIAQSTSPSSTPPPANAEQRGRRSPSVLSLDVPSLSVKSNEHQALSSRTPRSTHHSPRQSIVSSVMTPSAGMMTRRKSSVVTDIGTDAGSSVTSSPQSHHAVRKHEGGWYGISWDQIEQSLVEELTARIDNPRHDGLLTCFSMSAKNHATPASHMRLRCNSSEPIWWNHALDLKRFQGPVVDVFDVKVTQQPVINTAHSRASRSSRSSSQHITPRLSMVPGGSGVGVMSNIVGSTISPNQRRPLEASVANELSSRRRRVGGRRSSMSSRRSSSVGGSSANSHTGDEGETTQEGTTGNQEGLLPALPVLARDALRTPHQAAEDVREKLRASSVECLVNYRRVPMLSPFSDEWLRNLDHVLLACRDHLNDPTASIAVAVSSPDTVWLALFACVLWEADAKHVAPRKPLSTAFNGSLNAGQRSFLNSGPASAAPESPTESTTLDAMIGGDIAMSFQNTSHEEAAGSEAALGSPPLGHGGAPDVGCIEGDMGEKPSSPSDVPPSADSLLEPINEFPVLQTMGDEIPQLRVHESVPGVMAILHATRTKSLVYDAIFVHLREADAAAAAGEWKRCKEQCLEAVTSFQKFTILVVFYAFVLYQAEDHTQNQAMSLAQRIAQHKAQKKNQTGYFRDFILGTPRLYHRIHHVNLWECNKQRTCPLGSGDTYAFQGEDGCRMSEQLGLSCLDGDHRWRSDVLMPNFS